MKSNENCGGNSQKLLKAGTFSNYLSENSQGLELQRLKLMEDYQKALIQTLSTSLSTTK